MAKAERETFKVKEQDELGVNLEVGDVWNMIEDEAVSTGQVRS